MFEWIKDGQRLEAVRVDLAARGPGGELYRWLQTSRTVKLKSVRFVETLGNTRRPADVFHLEYALRDGTVRKMDLGMTREPTPEIRVLNGSLSERARIR